MKQKCCLILYPLFVATGVLSLHLGPVGAGENNIPKSLSLGGSRFAVVGEGEDRQYDFRLDLSRQNTSSPVEILAGYQNKDNFYRLVLTNGSAEMFRRLSGKETRLLAGTGAIQLASALHVILRRRHSMFYLDLNGKSALEAMDSTFSTGSIALREGSGTVSNLRYQPVDDINFSDDFMRTDQEQQLGVWKMVKGSWRFHSVRETNPNADFRRSVNPFALGGHASSNLVHIANRTFPDIALVTAGYGFWVDYVYEASLKSTGGTAGIAFNYKGDQDYYLVRWDMSSPYRRSSKIELVRVRPTGKTVLESGYAECGADQWYRLGVHTRGRRMQVLLDGDLLFDVVDREATGGLVGLYTEGTRECYFDDISVQTNRYYVLDRYDTWIRDGSPVSGKWSFKLNSSSEIVGGSGPHFLLSQSDATSQYLFGDPSWQEPIVDLKFKNPNRKGWVGISFGDIHSSVLNVVRWTAEASLGGERLQLVKISRGKETVVANSPTNAGNGEWHKLQLDLSESNRVRAYFDGVMKIRVKIDNSERGQLGVYTAQAKGTTIDTVTVAFDKEQGKEQVVNNEIFRSDPFMLLWSSEKGDWFPVRGMTNAYWHKGDFYGPFALTLPFSPGTQANMASTEQSFATGYEVTMSTEPDAKNKMTLKRQGETVAQCSLPSAISGNVTIHREDEFFWVNVGDNEALTFHDAKPLKGTHIGLRLAGAADFDKVKLERYHVIDHLFEAAPVDWVRIGTWEITNRFSCTPTWSHMSARTEQDAVLWNKFALEGDFTIEYYAGMRMQSTKPLTYPRTGDINMTFSADGKDLSSGYSYVVGAWDPGWTGKWTQLLRGTEVVAQTDRYLIPRVREGQGGRQIEVPLISEGRPIHGAWYYIKVRKIGNRIQCYFDNELVLTYQDKNPMRGKHFALWTQDNEIVVARMKISYEGVTTPSRREKPAPTLSVPSESEPYLTISSPSHSGVCYDFERSLEGWKTADQEHGALLEVDEGARASGKSSLKLTNVNTGGNFGVKAPIPYGLDLLKVSDLSFSYKMPREARVNVYLKIRGQNHFIEFTGDPTTSELLPRVGRIEGVLQDNQWHHATFPLGVALRAMYPLEKSLLLDEMTMGNFHEGYLKAGFGGNLERTVYHLDDFQMMSTDLQPPVLQWTVRSTGSVAPSLVESVYRIDRKPETDPTGAEGTTDSRKEFPNLESGKWYFHVKGKTTEGKWTSPAHFVLHVNPKPVLVASVDPPNGSRWGGSPVTLKLQSEERMNPLEAGSTLSLNGSLVSDIERYVRYDFGKNTLTLDVSRAPLNFSDGHKVELSLHLVQHGGQSSDSSWNYTVDRSKDETPPAPVVLADYSQNSFEQDTGTFKGADAGSVVLVTDSSTAVSGKSSLKVVNAKLGSNMQVLAWDRPFSAGNYPLLSFDYRVPQEVHSDIILGTVDHPTHLIFADTDTSSVYPTLGTVSSVVRDDQWHHTDINLYSLLAQQPFQAKMFDLSSVSFGDFGYAGVAPGSGYHLDNFQLVPEVNGQRGVTLSWQTSDFSGLKGYSARWSNSPTDSTDPVVNASEPTHTFTVQEEGVQYLHLRAQDNAGNWSEPVHYRFVVDNSPPAVGTPSPASGQKFGSSHLEIPISDGGYSGIDPSSLAVAINDKEFPMGEIVTDFDAQRQKITWDWALVSGFSEQPVPDGTEVKFALKPIKDFAGNQTALLQWTARIDYATDKEPPTAPEVKSPSQSLLSLDTFTKDLGGWDDWGGRKGFDLVRCFDTGKQDYVVRLVAGGARRGSGAYIHRGAYDVVKHPYLSFQYKFGAESKIQILCLIGGQWRSLQLTGSSRRFTALGTVSGIAQDGQWHTAFINLQSFLAAAYPNQSSLMVEGLSLGEEGSSGEYFVDNFAIFGPGKAVPQFSWTDVDPTGIASFSYQIDQNPDTVPDTTGEGNERDKTLQQLAPGMWYLHIRAQDGAGNWSSPMHYPYFVGG
ncbi:MAG: hypothetical protein HY318_05735 [Armatimonadetes bacterium]|nr:hypothetical protein [Armatimonadota bacterium]